jgi:hypothetical protein
MVIFVDEEAIGFTRRFKVAIESQPSDEVSVTEYVPLVSYRLLFHVKGSSVSQMVMFVDEEVIRFTSRFKIATESQPSDEVRVTE